MIFVSGGICQAGREGESNNGAAREAYESCDTESVAGVLGFNQIGAVTPGVSSRRSTMKVSLCRYHFLPLLIGSVEKSLKHDSNIYHLHYLNPGTLSLCLCPTIKVVSRCE